MCKIGIVSVFGVSNGNACRIENRFDRLLNSKAVLLLIWDSSIYRQKFKTGKNMKKKKTIENTEEKNLNHVEPEGRWFLKKGFSLGDMWIFYVTFLIIQWGIRV